MVKKIEQKRISMLDSDLQLFPDDKKFSADEIVENSIKKWKTNPIEDDPKNIKFIKDRFVGQKTRILALNGLGLKEIPDSLRKLKNIENVDLSDNEIQFLPEWISELKELKGINLANNKLKNIAYELDDLRQLQVIWLSNNNLENLPVCFLNLPIKELQLNNNPKLGIPKSVLERPVKEILRYFFESRAQDGQPLLELKLLLVGRGKAGKTAIVKQLAGEEPDENELETHSISIREFFIDCPNGQVRTRAWDFGGQEILHSTHQFFLTERSLYLLVLEPRTGLAQRDAEYWLKLIETQGVASPVIVALNWSDKKMWKIDEVKLKRKFPFIVDFISTDAISGYGIDKLKNCIIETVQKDMPDVWLPFPRHWRNIKNVIASMKNNFLTYSQYTALCKRHGEIRPDAQADLAGILHALGLALYFGKDPRLHDTRVLNPGWVTGGVYSVIRSTYVENKDGQLAASDMKFVLKEAQNQKVIKSSDYPSRTHYFILELMRAFQLCYASEEENGRPSRYLVPELLPEFEPNMFQNWDAAKVKLRYRYNTLPPGLLSRFIVQTYALSEDAPHWRHGVVLQHSEAEALIREESDRNELQVYILGEDEETRGVLIAILRRELEVLHNAMKIQPIEELELIGENGQWISVKSLKEVEKPNSNKQRLPIQPDGTAEVNVSEELNKLIPFDVRIIDRNEKKPPIPIKVFVSYAHEDERKLKRLDAILDVLEQQHGLTSWLDKRLIAGDEWDTEIRERLEEMDIFLFIASQTSIVRPYIRDPEISRALERKFTNNVEIVIVKLEPCASDEDFHIGKYQRLATKYKSIAEASLKSAAWEQVRKDLLPVIERIRNLKIDKMTENL